MRSSRRGSGRSSWAPPTRIRPMRAAGYAVLRRAGIEVVTGVLEAECADLNLIFNHWITSAGPLLAGKFATTLDGRIATPHRASPSGSRARRRAPTSTAGAGSSRRSPSAAGTVMKDNPRLTARVEGEPECCPVRFVFDGRLRSVLDRKLPRVYTDEFAAKTVVVTTQHGGLGYVRKLREMGVGVWVFESPSGCGDPGPVPRAVRVGGHLRRPLRGRLEAHEPRPPRAPDRLPFLLPGARSSWPTSARSRSSRGLRMERLAQAIRLSDLRRADPGRRRAGQGTGRLSGSDPGR